MSKATQVAWNALRITVALVAAGLLWTPGARGNPLTLTLHEDGYADEVVTGTSPSVFYTGSFGAFSANVVGSVTLSSPTALDLSSGNISTATGGTLVITVTEAGMMDPSGMTEWFQQFVGTFIPGPGISVSSTDSVDGIMLSTLSCTSTPCSEKHTTDLGAITGPFTLTETITIVSTGANSFSLDQNLIGRRLFSTAGEPGSLVLLGLGLLALAAFGRRRKGLDAR